jgi:nitrite reductase (cytochrome c-552)
VSCRQNAGFLRERVLYEQKRTFDQLLKAEELSVKAHEAVRLAAAYTGERAPDYNALLAQARDMVRKGQLFWDYISAENSVGFHNPVKALDTLMTSAECSNKAVELASQATKFGIAPALVGEIEKIVPPILEHSRKLMQSPEHLQSHPWLRMLQPLPKSDQVWDGQTRASGGQSGN